MITFRLQPGFLTIYTDQVMITQVGDTAEGLEMLGALVDPQANRTKANVSAHGIFSLCGNPLNPAPELVAIKPNTGSNQDEVQVVIKGSGFLTGLNADLGPYMALNVEVVSSSTLSATIPAGLPGGIYSLTIYPTAICSLNQARRSPPERKKSVVPAGRL